MRCSDCEKYFSIGEVEELLADGEHTKTKQYEDVGDVVVPTCSDCGGRISGSF